MKKTFILCLIGFLSIQANSQNLEAGKRFYYYQRYASAEKELRPLIVNNTEATYWLGQTLIQQKDSVQAETIYRDALNANSNNALILAGLGQIELMQNQPDSARRHFEQALSASDGKDREVYHAIARANIEAQNGDADYAIQTLNAIPKRKRKDLKNAETYLLMGTAYRKKIDGGGAVTAFNQALSMDPSLAEAKYQTAKVYLTQNNADVFLPALEEAVQLDPKYAPALYELFYYWFERDINKARAYFNNYLAASDKTPSAEYDKVSIIYASRDYQTAIDSAKAQLASSGETADPRYYKLLAYSYEELKDSVMAKNYLDQYFSKQKPAGFVAQDYVFRASNLSKFPGNDSEISAYYEKALLTDTTQKGKEKIMRDAASYAARSGNFTMQAEWLGRTYKADSLPSNRDLYDWGYAHYKAGNFVTADSIFCGIYTQKYPEEIFGYLWCARAAGAQDTTMEKGTAVEPYKRLIAFARASGEREDYKATLIQAHGYLASYYANVAKEKDSAVVYLQNILRLDPDNASASKYIEILTKQDKTQTSSATKPKAGRRASPANKTSSDNR